MTTILLIVLILLLIGALPAWPYSSGWGYYPSGALGVILLVVLVLFLAGRVGRSARPPTDFKATGPGGVPSRAVGFPGPEPRSALERFAGRLAVLACPAAGPGFGPPCGFTRFVVRELDRAAR